MLVLILEHLSLPEPPSLQTILGCGANAASSCPGTWREPLGSDSLHSEAASTGELVPYFGEGSGKGLPSSAVDRPVFPSLAPMFFVSSPTCFAPPVLAAVVRE